MIKTSGLFSTMTSITFKIELPSAANFKTLRCDTSWGELTLEQAEQALSNSLTGVAVLQGDRSIGMARIIGDGVLNLYIQDVIIAKPHRGKGYGKKLMSVLIDYMKNTYPESCTIGLMAAKGQADFYAEFGFQHRPGVTTDAGMTAPLGTLKSRLVKTASTH